MNINKAMSICHKANLKVYGVNRSGKMYVEVNESNKITPSKILHNSSKSLNEAVAKTYIHYANKLSEKPQHKKQNSEYPS